jgi:hypothetical protein
MSAMALTIATSSIGASSDGGIRHIPSWDAKRLAGFALPTRRDRADMIVP